MIRQAEVADAAAIARVHVDTWRTAYAGILPNERLAAMSYDRSEQKWRNYLSEPSAHVRTLVAEIAGGGLVGFASAGPIRNPIGAYQGELYMLYVSSAYHRIGIGKELVFHAAHHLLACAMESMVAWVFKDNPSLRFYLSIGGEQVGEREVDFGGRSLVEVACAWPNLHVLSPPQDE